MDMLIPREAKIFECGHGLEFAGTRISLFDVMDYLKHKGRGGPDCRCERSAGMIAVR